MRWATGRKAKEDRELLRLLWRFIDALYAQRPPDFEAAEMDIHDLNVGLIKSTDETFNINVTAGLEAEFADYVAIWMCGRPGDALGPWRIAHFTPERARIIATCLVSRANLVEGTG